MTMAFWAIAALMTVAVLGLLLRPLLRPRADVGRPAGAHDLAVYRDQLREIELEGARGRIGESEAALARLEIERRMLAADSRTPPPARRPVPLWATALLLGVLAAGAMPLYARLGAPGLPDNPLAGRSAVATAPGLSEADLAAIVAMPEAEREAFLRGMVEGLAERLKGSHGDLDGWRRLARGYAVLGEAALAREAWAKAVHLAPDSAEAQLAYAESILAAAKPGTPMPPAFGEAVARARALEPGNLLALYLAGVDALAQGRRDEAAVLWRQLLDKMPGDAPERGPLLQQIEALEGG